MPMDLGPLMLRDRLGMSLNTPYFNSTPMAMVWCYPSALGWGARIGLLLYVVGDRLLNAQRVSTEEIRSLVALDDYAIFQIGSTAILGIYLLLLLLKPNFRRLLPLFTRSPLLWIALYIGFACMSTLWSQAPLLTAFKAIQCAVFLPVAVLAMGGLQNIEQRIRYLAVIALAYLATAYIAYWMWSVPEWGLNIVSLHFVVGTVPFLGNLYLVKVARLRGIARSYWGLVLPFALIETVFTSLMAIITAQALFIYMRLRHLIRYLIPYVLVLVAIFFVILLPKNPDAMVLGIKSVKEITEGTGRFEVWDYALSKSFFESPFVGRAFVLGDAIGRTEGINVALGQMHNAHLSALMNLGIIGAALWIAFLFGSYRAIARHPDRNVRAALAAAALIYAFQQMFGGASLSSSLHVVWVSHALFFSLVAIETIHRRPAQYVVVAVSEAGRLRPVTQP